MSALFINKEESFLDAFLLNLLILESENSFSISSKYVSAIVYCLPSIYLIKVSTSLFILKLSLLKKRTIIKSNNANAENDTLIIFRLLP